MISGNCLPRILQQWFLFLFFLLSIYENIFSQKCDKWCVKEFLLFIIPILLEHHRHINRENNNKCVWWSKSDSIKVFSSLCIKRPLKRLIVKYLVSWSVHVEIDVRTTIMAIYLLSNKIINKKNYLAKKYFFVFITLLFFTCLSMPLSTIERPKGGCDVNIFFYFCNRAKIYRLLISTLIFVFFFYWESLEIF